MCNLQGDIIAILNSSGNTVVTYEYDSWGKLLSTTGTLASTVGADNSFRYRGYYYDTETSLYYLNQRYYNSEWGRFISADDYMGSTGGLLSHNVFAYCANNPVMRVDPSGQISIEGINRGGGRKAKKPPSAIDEYNCSAYAAGKFDSGQLGNSASMSTEKARDAFIAYVGTDEQGNAMARKYFGQTAVLGDDEYLVAVSSGTKYSSLSGRVISDYHFVVRNPNGEYTHKPGKQAIVSMDVRNVSQSWDLALYNPSSLEVIARDKGFYDNEVLYVAVKLKARTYGFVSFE